MNFKSAYFDSPDISSVNPLLIRFLRSVNLKAILDLLRVPRVNRFHGLPLTDPNEKFKIEERFDFVESLLDRNLTHIVEDIFEYVGFESTW